MNQASDDTSKILTQADALMNRHRSHRVFVARDGTETTAPEDATAPVDEDFPVLTDVVTDDKPAGSGDDAGAAKHLARQTQQIEDTLENWLDKRLPDEVLRVMDGVSDQLIGTLVTRMRAELLPQLMSSLRTPKSGDNSTPNQGD